MKKAAATRRENSSIPGVKINFLNGFHFFVLAACNLLNYLHNSEKVQNSLPELLSYHGYAGKADQNAENPQP